MRSILLSVTHWRPQDPAPIWCAAGDYAQNSPVILKPGQSIYIRREADGRVLMTMESPDPKPLDLTDVWGWW